MSSVGPKELARQLREWAVAEWGDDADVGRIWPMPGNAGLSFGFELRRLPDKRPKQLVIRLAPPGVRREGNTDVLAQVPILQALPAYDVPAAPLVWWGDESEYFGTDAFIVDMLPGKPLHMTEGSNSTEIAPHRLEALFDQAISVLVCIHSIRADLLALPLSRHRSPLEEVAFWKELLSKTETSSIIEGERLSEMLVVSCPPDIVPGLVHGDFQTNNLLFAEGRLTGVLDWELSGIGPQLLDLGWLSMMCDPECWAPNYQQLLRVTWDREDLRDRYAEKSGRPVANFDWYTALACLRFGAIVAFNTRLHRTGKRRDPLYEILAPSVPSLFERGQRLLG